MRRLDSPCHLQLSMKRTEHSHRTYYCKQTLTHTHTRYSIQHPSNTYIIQVISTPKTFVLCSHIGRINHVCSWGSCWYAPCDFTIHQHSHGTSSALYFGEICERWIDAGATTTISMEGNFKLTSWVDCRFVPEPITSRHVLYAVPRSLVQPRLVFSAVEVWKMRNYKNLPYRTTFYTNHHDNFQKMNYCSSSTIFFFSVFLCVCCRLRKVFIRSPASIRFTFSSGHTNVSDNENRFKICQCAVILNVVRISKQNIEAKSNQTLWFDGERWWRGISPTTKNQNVAAAAKKKIRTTSNS